MSDLTVIKNHALVQAGRFLFAFDPFAKYDSLEENPAPSGNALKAFAENPSNVHCNE